MVTVRPCQPPGAEGVRREAAELEKVQGVKCPQEMLESKALGSLGWSLLEAQGGSLK